MSPITDSLLTTTDVCDVLRVSRWTVARLRKRGELETVHVLGSPRITRKSLDRYLRKITPA